MKTYKNANNRSNKMGSGLILLVIGLIFFFRNLGIGIPDWILSWHTFLILIGVSIGYKRDFKGGGWLAMVLIGAYFTLEDMAGLDFSPYYFATGLIGVGLYLILKPSKQKDRFKNETVDFGTVKPAEPGDIPIAESEYIDSINVFSASKQHIYSKNFRGGDIVAIFGGCDLNLSQADMEGTVILDLIAIFGGVKIIVPPGWVVKSEITAVFGGVDDKRSVLPATDGLVKILRIKGVALFGGVDIRNF